MKLEILLQNFELLEQTSLDTALNILLFCNKIQDDLNFYNRLLKMSIILNSSHFIVLHAENISDFYIDMSTLNTFERSKTN